MRKQSLSEMFDGIEKDTQRIREVGAKRAELEKQFKTIAQYIIIMVILGTIVYFIGFMWFFIILGIIWVIASIGNK